MNKKYLILFFATMFLISGCSMNSNSSEVLNENVEKNKEEIIYESDKGIQKFLILYNKLFSDNKISKDMLTKYNHHGSEHDNQAKFILEGNEIVLSDNYLLDNQYNIDIVINNDMNDENVVKEITLKFAKVFNENLSSEKFDEFWDKMRSSGSPNNDELDGIEFILYKNPNTNELEYLSIEGKINSN